MQRQRRPLQCLPPVLLAIMVGMATGCTLDLTAAARPLLPGDVRTGDDSVYIAFDNLAVEEAVDVEFYTATTALASLPDDLFVEDHEVDSGIGVAGTGIMEPLDQDLLIYPCDPDLTIGTAGGRFLDNNTGELLGVGQPRWVQEAPLSLCGRLVTFEFSGTAGDYLVTVSVTNLPE